MIHAFLHSVLIVYFLAAALPAFAAFTDNGDGTVTDTFTGLMWDKCSWGQSNTDTCADGTVTTHTWAQALGVAITANSANHRGYNDWRLPNIKELASLVRTDSANLTIDRIAFPNTASSVQQGKTFWSSTTYVQDTVGAWYVNFSSGDSNAYPKSYTFRVRLVRSGQSFAAIDSLVTDAPIPIFGNPASPIAPPVTTQVSYTVSDGTLPATAVEVVATGTLGSVTIKATVDLSKIDAANRFSAGYNVYVAALVPGRQFSSVSDSWFMNARNSGWRALVFPLSEFLENAVANSVGQKVVIDIVTNSDLSRLIGTEVYLGYGQTDQEMLASKRYRGIYKVQQQ